MMIFGRRTLFRCLMSTALLLLCLVQRGEAFVAPVPIRSMETSTLVKTTVAVRTTEASTLQAFRSGRHDKHPQQVGWHRRVLKKVFRRHGRRSKSKLTSASTVAIDMHDLSSLERTNRVQDGVLLNNIQLPSPVARRQVDQKEVVLASEVAPLVAIDEQKEEIRTATNSDASFKEAKTSVGVFSRLTGNAFQNILTSRLNRWSNGENEGMSIQCSPCNSNSVFKLLRGKFQCDATLELDRIVFGNIQFSGGRLEVQRFGLNLWSFIQAARTGNQTSPRYLNQFDFVGHNLTMTQDDLFESSCIRNGLQRLLTRILRNRGMEPKQVTIKSIKILQSGKLSVIGEAVPKVLGAPPVPFEVHSGLGITSRGHILTFPGLKISLTPGKGFFVPVIPELTLDLGHNAKLNSVNLDGESHELHLSAKVTITPEHTMHTPKKFKQSSKSYAAMCSFDVGQWLTNLGRFAH